MSTPLRTLTAALLALALALPALAAAAGPTERVRGAVEQVIAILEDDTLDRAARWERIAAVIGEGFDFPSMSQSVLATHWQRATPAEQRRFTEFFSQYIEQVYREKIEGYSGQAVEYRGERVSGDRAVVDTVILSGGTEIPVTFRLRDNDGEWYAYDVVIEGVSLVNNYRSTFAAIVRRDGMDGLLADIQARIDRHKAGQVDAGG